MGLATAEYEIPASDKSDVDASIHFAGELALKAILDDYEEAIEAEAIFVAQRLAAEKRLFELLSFEVLTKLQADKNIAPEHVTINIKEDRYSNMPPIIWIKLTFDQSTFKGRSGEFKNQIGNYLLKDLRPYLAATLNTSEAPCSSHRDNEHSFGIFSPRINKSEILE